MTGVDPGPIAADSLRRREEWQAAFPGSTMLWEQTADEGQGIGFDGLDPSAMMRALFATAATWAEVLGWYRSVLEPRGWKGKEVKPSTWWQWTSTERPGEKIEVLDRGHWEQRPGWPLPEERVGQLGFEVIFTARGAFSATTESTDA
ncbi:MAG TPA: hypothetical protein VGQ64_01105 [Candidatus Limnocylindrales bacterium]|nr:hypothetical protein [Candidatus Limnocylindrales bacterium]